MSPDPFDGIDPATGIGATAVTFYAGLYPELREAARRVGWALALHGSLRRDLDLVAIPWTEDAAPAGALLEAIVEASGGFQIGNTSAGYIAEKPHGRHAVTISLGGSGGMIDLSIMPRRPPGTPACTLCGPNWIGQCPHRRSTE